MKSEFCSDLDVILDYTVIIKTFFPLVLKKRSVLMLICQVCQEAQHWDVLWLLSWLLLILIICLVIIYNDIINFIIIIIMIIMILLICLPSYYYYKYYYYYYYHLIIIFIFICPSVCLSIHSGCIIHMQTDFV